VPVLFVRKKDGDLRMCIDYRVLNKITVRNEYPLSKINELLDTLQSAKFFITLDLNMVYHQIRIKEEDIAKTVFTCTEGYYEFLVMTFGLTNAPATFQEIMNKVFQKQKGKSVVVYLDDIMIFSKT
jgi:Reverse transcriptase (RNA-dependent DNA polymerase)